MWLSWLPGFHCDYTHVPELPPCSLLAAHTWPEHHYRALFHGLVGWQASDQEEEIQGQVRHGPCPGRSWCPDWWPQRSGLRILEERQLAKLHAGTQRSRLQPSQLTSQSSQGWGGGPGTSARGESPPYSPEGREPAPQCGCSSPWRVGHASTEDEGHGCGWLGCPACQTPPSPVLTQVASWSPAPAMHSLMCLQTVPTVHQVPGWELGQQQRASKHPCGGVGKGWGTGDPAPKHYLCGAWGKGPRRWHGHVPAAPGPWLCLA